MFQATPYRHVNWKATARSMLPHKVPQPKVNEFEREGKKVVWIFLDRSASMALGPITKSALEYAIEAATGLSCFYLERDCKVGLCMFNGAEKIVFPDVGRKQYYRILRELIRAEVEKSRDSSPPNLREAVEKCHEHLVGVNPPSIIITSMSPKNYRQIIDGVREIWKYAYPVRSRSRQIIIQIIIIRCYGI